MRVSTALSSIVFCWWSSSTSSPSSLVVHALASSTAGDVSSSSSSPSPWAPATWTLTLNLGRESGTDMAPSWAASGGRLVVPVMVRVESESCDPATIPNGFCGGRGASFLLARPSDVEDANNDANTNTYITNEGQQTLDVSNGGWTMEFPSGGGQGRATQLKFWLTLQTQARKNDVVLEAGSVLCGQAICWREDEWEVGRTKMIPIQQQADEAQSRLDQQLSHETGDRRLDGSDPLETLQGYKDMAALVLDRDLKLQNKVKALKVYPPIDQDLPEGAWPGAEEWLSVSTSSNPLYVVRKTMLGEDYQLVGTFKATPVFSEEDDSYEEY
jgi:hypothetical protein